MLAQALTEQKQQHGKSSQNVVPMLKEIENIEQLQLVEFKHASHPHIRRETMNSPKLAFYLNKAIELCVGAITIRSIMPTVPIVSLDYIVAFGKAGIAAGIIGLVGWLLRRILWRKLTPEQKAERIFQMKIQDATIKHVKWVYETKKRYYEKFAKESKFYADKLSQLEEANQLFRRSITGMGQNKK